MTKQHNLKSLEILSNVRKVFCQDAKMSLYKAQAAHKEAEQKRDGSKEKLCAAIEEWKAQSLSSELNLTRDTMLRDMILTEQMQTEHAERLLAAASSHCEKKAEHYNHTAAQQETAERLRKRAARIYDEELDEQRMDQALEWNAYNRNSQ